MKKILLLVSMFLFTMMSFNQVSFAQAPTSKPHLSQAKQTLAWPTDVLVENYSGQSVTVRFITVVSDHTVKVDPYPATYYYTQLLDQYNSYQVRVMIWDFYGRLFFDKNVGSVNRITLSPPSKGDKLSVKDILISK